MIEKLLDYLYRVNEIYEQIKNEKVEQELENLSKVAREEDSYNYNDPQVQAVIDQLNKTILKEEN